MTPQLLRSIANSFHYHNTHTEVEIIAILEDCKNAAAEGYFAHLVTLKIGEEHLTKSEVDYIVRRLQDAEFLLEMSYDQHKEEVDLKIEW